MGVMIFILNILIPIFTFFWGRIYERNELSKLITSAHDHIKKAEKSFDLAEKIQRENMILQEDLIKMKMEFYK
jgi:hypothetical protein